MSRMLRHYRQSAHLSGSLMDQHAPHSPLYVEPLEGRQLLAVAPVVFTGVDADGDTYTVRLTNGGTMTVVPADQNQGIASITLANTNPDSRLSISVIRRGGGDGVVTLNTLTTDGSATPLGEIFAPKVDLVTTGITVTGALNRLTLRDVVSGADINVGGASTDNLRFRARFISNTGTDATAVVTGTRVSTLGLAGFLGGSFTAASFGSIEVNGLSGSNIIGVIDGSLTATDADAEYSARSIRVRGEVRGGSWTFASRVGPITATAIINAWSLNTTAQVGTITTTQGLAGTLEAGGYDRFDIGGVFSAAVTSNGSPDDFPTSIRSFYARQISEGSITSADQDIGSITTQNWAGGGLSARTLRSLRVTGGSQRLGIFGNLSNVDMAITDTLSTISLRSFYVRGTMSSSTLRVQSNADVIDVGGTSAARIFVGVQTALTNFPSTTADFTIDGGRLNTFRVRGAFSQFAPGIGNLQLGVKDLGRFITSTLIRTQTGGAAFGVAARSIDFITFRNASGQQVSLSNLNQPGSGQILNFGNFEVRVI